MSQRTVCTSLALLLAASCVGCNLASGLVGTKIVVQDRRQSLRNQILGSYEALEDEVYLLAGVRAIDPVSGAPRPAPRMTRSEKAALDARRSMEFNRDDVLRFKRRRYVGEGNDALLVFFREQQEKLKTEDPRLYRLVKEITAEENRDRMAIMKRIVETTPDLAGEKGLQTVRAILTEYYREQAEPGMSIQTSDGAWTTKKPRERTE